VSSVGSFFSYINDARSHEAKISLQLTFIHINTIFIERGHKRWIKFYLRCFI